jgi:hypothetical protein
MPHEDTPIYRQLVTEMGRHAAIAVPAPDPDLFAWWDGWHRHEARQLQVSELARRHGVENSVVMSAMNELSQLLGSASSAVQRTVFGAQEPGFRVPPPPRLDYN